jgi:flavodoxin
LSNSLKRAFYCRKNVVYCSKFNYKGAYMAILIAYYSHSGNTGKIAALIQKEVGGTLFPIEPETAYPADYAKVVELSKKEIPEGYKPPLKTKAPDLAEFDTVFVGSPNWLSTFAPPVATFLAENDLSGKKVVPFATYGGGGLGKIAEDVAKLCPKSTVLEALALSGKDVAGGEAAISAWLKKIGLSD